MDTITCAQLPDLFREVGRIFGEKKDELCEMDAKLGDGDLGLTMSKGYGAFPSLLEENRQENDIGRTLMKAGTKLASAVPSTMGTLMASGILEGGKALKGEREIDSAGLSAFLAGFAAGIRKRGKCERGDRTILDAAGAAADRTSSLLEGRPSAALPEMIGAAVLGAREGVEATRSMTPKFGKAAVFSQKAVGMPDQGAVAFLYLLIGMQNYIR